MSNPLDILLPEPSPPVPVFQWATVLAGSPLEIQFDGDSEPLKGPPSTLVTLVTGDRVFAVVVERRVTILGKVP